MMNPPQIEKIEHTSKIYKIQMKRILYKIYTKKCRKQFGKQVKYTKKHITHIYCIHIKKENDYNDNF